MKPLGLVISCEHAVNTVPVAYQKQFAPYRHLLESHSGIDFGALFIARYLQQVFNCDFIQAQATRLLIDCNRSLTHPRCFSEITINLPQAEKEQLIQQYYLPFRQAVVTKIEEQIAQDRQVLHLSIHSFTPILNAKERNADIGFLYDPGRASEKMLAREWQQQLKQHHSQLRTRLNYPYLGISDGFTRALRKQFVDQDYAGIEVETNQALVRDEKTLIKVAEALATTFQQAAHG
ncbi:TPA: N-formylglutamate amidohydrolase [Legionella feeleii]|uniref:N-formylglutamate amidohydrolase n=1 Tax=Legionella feeleii TaxID=453 RepID=A0A0W0THT7_9GAMM|nr:N-formylglutamate amidohydrolase [Legionella feeleii]KTC95175.1 N-formylglutamate amidohydrolase [Legionella feeleii]SPX62467.1 N-formylglutamate amidohydrolase [Legionella feeleii]